MKRAVLLLAPLSLVLASCAALPVISTVADVVSGPVATAVGNKVEVKGYQGLIVAHNAVQFGITAINPLVRNDVLTPAQVTTYEGLVNEAEDLGIKGRSTLTVAQRTARLLNIASEFESLKSAARK